MLPTECFTISHFIFTVFKNNIKEKKNVKTKETPFHKPQLLSSHKEPIADQGQAGSKSFNQSKNQSQISESIQYQNQKTQELSKNKQGSKTKNQKCRSTGTGLGKNQKTKQKGVVYYFTNKLAY